MLVDAPSFASIANKPGQSIEAIAGHIVIPHSVMPQAKLTRDEIAALSAYILSLRGNTP
jgi:mono/diheme cytochrome c family protein